MERILAVLAKEEEYAEELSEYLNSCDDFPYRALAFSEVSAYCSYESEHRVEFLLGEEELIAECREKENREITAEKICPLIEYSYLSEITEPNGIFKYQASEQIKRDILSLFLEKECEATPKKIRETETGVQLTCVCSPLGGSYKSTFALSLARYYSQRTKTLFVTFDPFFVLPGEEKRAADSNLTDLIYYLEQSGHRTEEFIKRLTRHYDNLDCLGGVSHWFDIYDMKPQNMSFIIEAVTTGEYKSIVVDVGSIGAAAIELLLACDRLYVPVNDTVEQDRRIVEWKRQLAFSGHNEVINKIREITIPYDDGMKGNLSFDALLLGRVGRFIETLEQKTKFA